jgi:hypothetical protein
LSKNPDIIRRNFDAAINLLTVLGAPTVSEPKYYLWRNAGITAVKDFLRHFEAFDNLKSASPANLLRFIEHNEPYGELNSWSIGVLSKERAARRTEVSSLGIGLTVRNQEKDKSNDELYYIRKSHIISPWHEFIDLTPEEVRQALTRTEQLWAEKGKEGSPVYPSGEVVRNTTRKPNRPLLLIYFLDPAGTVAPNGAELIDQTPVIGYAISFPANDRDDAVSFAVHSQLLDKFNNQDDEDITQQDDDED